MRPEDHSKTVDAHLHPMPVVARRFVLEDYTHRIYQTMSCQEQQSPSLSLKNADLLA